MRRSSLSTLLLILALLSTSLPARAVEQPEQMTPQKLTAEDKEILKMLELLEMLELLNNMEDVAAVEDN